MGDGERPLRVCLVSEEQEGWGGIGTYTAVLARALRESAHTVHVILRDWEADRREQTDGVTVHRLTVPEPSWRRGTALITEHLYGARESLRWSWRVRQAVRAIAARDGLDVVEMPEHRGAGAAYGLGPRRLRPTGLVTRLHTPAFLTERANAQRRSGDERAVETLERLAVRSADLLTAPSRAVAHAVAERFELAPERVRIIPNPVDDERFSPGGRAPGRPTVLCVGRLELVKGVDLLVRALPEILARHPDAELRLVGEDDEHGWQGGSMAAHLRQRARELAVREGALRIEGALPRGELPALMRAASVCVVPSRWENLPYSCLEAMACARPVIAARAGGLAEVITDGSDGVLFDAGDAEALTGAVCGVLADGALAARLGAAARQTVERRFGQRAVGARIAAAYRAVSSHPPAGFSVR